MGRERNQSVNFLLLGLCLLILSCAVKDRPVGSNQEGALTLPLAYQTKAIGKNENSTTNIGDILLGLKYPILESLFRNEWYPTISLLGGMKFPTGSVDTLQTGQFSPGTGNGNWEPYFGVGLSKEYGFAVLAVNATLTKRFIRNRAPKFLIPITAPWPGVTNSGFRRMVSRSQSVYGN